MLTTKKRRAIVEAAKAATPGPWHSNPDPTLNRAGVYSGEDDGLIICDVTDEDVPKEPNATYIALAHPQTILAYEEALAALEAERDMVVEDVATREHMLEARVKELEAALRNVLECYDNDTLSLQTARKVLLKGESNEISKGTTFSRRTHDP
jgi:hypothetical protein